MHVCDVNTLFRYTNNEGVLLFHMLQSCSINLIGSKSLKKKRLN